MDSHSALTFVLAAGLLGCSERRPEQVCPPLPASVPGVFSFHYAEHPSWVDNGPFLAITPAGKGRFWVLRGHHDSASAEGYDRYLGGVVDSTWIVDSLDVAPLYGAVQRVGFFCLDDRYWDDGLMDGTEFTVSVTVGGKSKRIVMYGATYPGHDQVYRAADDLGGISHDTR
jgi:hypothetical protein